MTGNIAGLEPAAAAANDAAASVLTAADNLAKDASVVGAEFSEFIGSIQAA